MEEVATDLIAAVSAFSGTRLQFDVIPPPPLVLPEVPRLLAGVAQADLTPPPGLPKAGYSRNAHTGTGFRTRLRATVLYLRCGRTSLALIATDLLGGSSLVQQLVAGHVAALTDVPLSGLFLSATHTHGAPGQFHGTDFYNRFSSNRPGADPGWIAFVAGQISAAVVEAASNRAPAALAWGRTQVHGYTRNRSLPAHRQNPGQGGQDASSAVNPDLNLLRVDSLAPSGGTTPLAAMTVFSIHGTGVPMSSRTYNADVWAYLCAEVSSRVAETHGPVAAGALQGTHGDVTPALAAPAGHPEAARIGRGIGAAAAALYTTLDDAIDRPEARAPQLGVALREVDLSVAPVVSGLRLPRRPAIGAALLGGARENETPVVARIPPFRADSGKRLGGRSEQAQKWVVGSRWLQPLALPLSGFPRVLPVHLARIGDVLLTGLPMEITTQAGRRIAAAAGDAFGAGVRPVVCSVVDEYAGYCTTEPEYARQFYEGGHTLYGPGTQRFLAAVAADLARRLSAGADLHEALPGRHFDLAIRRYLRTPPVSRIEEARYQQGGNASSWGSSSSPVPGGPRARSGDPAWGVLRGEPCLQWIWHGPAPGMLAWHRPMVSLDLPGGGVVTDGHGEIEIEQEPKRQAYAVRWYPQTTGGHRPQAMATDYRFRLLPS